MAADSKTRYLTLATRGFALHGFHGVSLAQLAGEAGVTKQALLHHFGTKEALYRQVLDGLAQRFLNDLESFDHLPADQQLAAYFADIASGQMAATEDASLVFRALLDSTDAAAVYPMKPYMDALIARARALPAWSDAPLSSVLAAIYQLLGMIQYVVISQPTLSGMYGAETFAEMRRAHEIRLKQHVDAFLNGR